MSEPNEPAPEPRRPPPDGAYTSLPRAAAHSEKESKGAAAKSASRPLVAATVLIGVGALTAAAYQGGRGVEFMARLLSPAAAAPGPAAESPAYSEPPAAAAISMETRARPASAPDRAVADSTGLILPQAGAAAAAGPASPPEPPASAAPKLRGFGHGGFGNFGGGHQAVAGGDSGGAGAGVPTQLAGLYARELASHPEVVPVLRKLFAYAKTDDQTGGFREAASHCGELYQCEHIGKQIAFTLSDGLRIVYTYMPGLAWGLRNHFDMTTPKGEHAQFSDSPLVLDLTGRGVATTAERTLFDLHGDGRRESLQALAPGLGVLALGTGTDGRFLFGNRTDLDGDGTPDGYADGFEALWALARKARREGVISRRALARGRLGARELRALTRAYGLRVRLGALNGPSMTLEQAGVTALFLPSGASRLTRDFDGRGDDVSRRGGAVFARKDGSRGEYADVWLRDQMVETKESLVTVK
jgi:hypothetical protein